MSFGVYRYRLLDPLDWGEDCHRHLFLQNKFWNALVEIEHAHRERYRQTIATDIAMAPLNTAIEELRSEQTKLREQRKALRKSARRRMPTPLIDERLVQISREIQSLAAMAKVQGVMARERMRDEVKKLDSERFEAAKCARQQSQLWWCNYNAVWKSYQRARKNAMREGAELRFHGFRGEGRFTVQIINGTSYDKLVSGQCSQIALDLTPQPVPWRANKPSRVPRLSLSGRPIGALPGREGRKQPRLTFTIYTHDGEDGKERRTLTFPILYDRPLPANGRIQEVVVTRRRLGTRMRHHVTFLVRIPEAPPAVSQSNAICGINLGFRLCTDGGLRVAMLADEAGTREIKLPAQWMSGMDAIEAIQQRRDRDRDDIAAVLKEQWPQRPEGAPQEIDERLGNLVRAPKFGAAKLAMAVIRWRQHPSYWPEMRERLEAWRQEDKHWLEIQANRRDHLMAQRRETYRLLAHEIAQRYGAIRLGEIQLRDIAFRERVDGSKNELHQIARRNRTRAALYLLHLEIRHQATKEGTALHLVAGGYTEKCHACDGLCAVTDELIHCCEHCSAIWDQDVNAARNILRAEPGECSRDEQSTAECSTQENQVDTELFVLGHDREMTANAQHSRGIPEAADSTLKSRPAE